MVRNIFMDNPKLQKIHSMLVRPGLVARAESKTLVSTQEWLS